jgi:hopanoid biosynthesis associated protein HpnK
VRRLIINADDFGFTPGVNRAILEAHSQGIVTSTTLMANAPAFAEAAELAAGAPRLAVGCHVVLLDGSCLLAPQQIPSLTTVESDAGQLARSLGRFAMRAVTGHLDPTDIEAEARAQIRKLQSAGVQVTHIDTHKHAHVFPVVWRALLRAAGTSGIRALRNPFSPRHALPFREMVRRPTLWKRYLQVFCLSGAAPQFRRAVQEAGLFTPDGSFGIVETGSLDLALFEAAVSCIPHGTWEFVCHPGYHDPDLAQAGTRLRQSRQLELNVLTSQQAHEALNRRGIQLISYRDLVN